MRVEAGLCCCVSGLLCCMAGPCCYAQSADCTLAGLGDTEACIVTMSQVAMAHKRPHARAHVVRVDWRRRVLWLTAVLVRPRASFFPSPNLQVASGNVIEGSQWNRTGFFSAHLVHIKFIEWFTICTVCDLFLATDLGRLRISVGRTQVIAKHLLQMQL